MFKGLCYEIISKKFYICEEIDESLTLHYYYYF
jgi:hypothetical protein